MKQLTIVLWLILWPLMCTLEKYISVLTRKLIGESMPDKTLSDRMDMFCAFIWILVTFILTFTV